MMKRMRSWLAQANPVVFVLFAGLAGFCAYFSMYAFRKPFTAATFDVVPGWDFALDYKIALVIAQVAGYALSKLIGVKVIAEMRAERRALAILLLIGASWLARLACRARRYIHKHDPPVRPFIAGREDIMERNVLAGVFFSGLSPVGLRMEGKPN